MSTIPLNNIQTPDEKQNKRPEWLKVQLPSGETFENVRGLMRSKTRCTLYAKKLAAPILANAGGVALLHFS